MSEAIDSDLEPSAAPDEAAADVTGVGAVDLAPLEASEEEGATNSLDLLADVDIELTVRVGLAQLPLKRLRGLGRGSVVVLDRRIGSHVDILANGTLVAQGELVAVDDCYGVRISRLAASKSSALQDQTG